MCGSKLLSCSLTYIRPSYDINNVRAIFHWILGSRWLPNANEIDTKKLNVHGQREPQLRGPNANYIPLARVGSTRPRVGSARRRIGTLGTNMLVSPTQNSHNAKGFILQWNVGFRYFDKSIIKKVN